jgi:hypothetical protein
MSDDRNTLTATRPALPPRTGSLGRRRPVAGTRFSGARFARTRFGRLWGTSTVFCLLTLSAPVAVSPGTAAAAQMPTVTLQNHSVARHSKSASAASVVPAVSPVQNDLAAALVARGESPFLAICTSDVVWGWDPNAVPQALLDVRNNLASSYAALYQAVAEDADVQC